MDGGYPVLCTSQGLGIQWILVERAQQTRAQTLFESHKQEGVAHPLPEELQHSVPGRGGGD